MISRQQVYINTVPIPANKYCLKDEKRGFTIIFMNPSFFIFQQDRKRRVFFFLTCERG